jgi:hypothetical protein
MQAVAKLEVPSASHIATSSSKTQHLTLVDPVPKGLDASDWHSIRAAYEAGQHAFRPVAGARNTWQARNPAQQWTTTFDPRGFAASPVGGGWEWGLELRSYGIGGAQIKVDGASVIEADGQRLTLTRDRGLKEWFLNDQRGLEHGFTVLQRPSTESSVLPLELTLAVRGGLRPQLSATGQAVDFNDAFGTKVITYTGLKVWDQDGKSLPSRFEAGPAGQGDASFRISVDDRGASYPVFIDPSAQQAYLKSSNTGVGDEFGRSVSVSGDTVVVGAPSEASSSTGVNSTPNDSASNSGAAYVYVRSGTTWTQQAYLKASNTGAGDLFGESVAVSGDTVVVGAYGEASSSTGVNSTPNDSAGASGAAYVYVRSGTTWTQQAYLKASNTGAGDFFGFSVSVSGDTVVVGARDEESSTAGVNSTPNNSAPNSGAAYVYVRSGTTWTQQAYLKASNTGGGDHFGRSVSLSGDTVVVGAWLEGSSSTGVNSTPNDSAFSAGAAYVYVRSGTTWTQQAYLKASNTGMGDFFGISVSVSGHTVVVGASSEDSSTTGVNSSPNDSAPNAGAAYVFVRSGTTWTQQAYLKASNTRANDNFGVSVSVSETTVLVGAHREDSSAFESGAVYVYQGDGMTLTQQAFLKASNRGADDNFGYAVSVSGDTAVIGALNEDSSSTGVNSTPNDSALDSGAAYVFVATMADAVFRNGFEEEAPGKAGGRSSPLVGRDSFEDGSFAIEPDVVQAVRACQADNGGESLGNARDTLGNRIDEVD